MDVAVERELRFILQCCDGAGVAETSQLGASLRGNCKTKKKKKLLLSSLRNYARGTRYMNETAARDERAHLL